MLATFYDQKEIGTKKLYAAVTTPSPLGGAMLPYGSHPAARLMGTLLQHPRQIPKRGVSPAALLGGSAAKPPRPHDMPPHPRRRALTGMRPVCVGSARPQRRGRRGK